MKTKTFLPWLRYATCAGAFLVTFSGVGRARMLGFEGIFNTTPSNYGGAVFTDNFDYRGLRAN